MRTVPLLSCLCLLATGSAVAQEVAPKLTTIHPFTCKNGRGPVAGVTVGAGGVLYGTAQYGGLTSGNCPNGCGVVYALTPPAAGVEHWTSQVLYHFTGHADGGWPYGGIAIGAGGVLYGTTTIRGAGYGTAFSLTPPAVAGDPWTFDTIWTFADNSNGGAYGGVTVGSTGTLYGSLFKLFGSLNIGTAFSLTPPASPGDPWTESDVSSDAIGSVALVVQVSSGTLFGTSEVGGSSGDGEIFAAVPPKEPGGAWSVTAVHSFAGGSDGNMPTAGLTLHAKGVLYGTTYSGGGSANCDNGCGTIFSLTPTAGAEGVGRAFTEAVLYAFSNGADGANPYAGVTEGTGGVLYTVTQQGGNTSCPGGCGTIASLTPPATLGDPWTPALVHSFTGDDGQYPTGTLVRDYTVFYGTTTRGGADGCGTVFELRL